MLGIDGRVGAIGSRPEARLNGAGERLFCAVQLLLMAAWVTGASQLRERGITAKLMLGIALPLNVLLFCCWSSVQCADMGVQEEQHQHEMGKIQQGLGEAARAWGESLRRAEQAQAQADARRAEQQAQDEVTKQELLKQVDELLPQQESQLAQLAQMADQYGETARLTEDADRRKQLEMIVSAIDLVRAIKDSAIKSLKDAQEELAQGDISGAAFSMKMFTGWSESAVAAQTRLSDRIKALNAELQG